jgi:hypothetical protein
MRSRAKREAVSTITVRTLSLARCCSMAAKPGPTVDQVRALHAVVAVLGDKLVAGSLGEASTADRWRLRVSVSSPTFVITRFGSRPQP